MTGLLGLDGGLRCRSEFLLSLPSALILPVPNKAVFLKDPLRFRLLDIFCESAIALSNVGLMTSSSSSCVSSACIGGLTSSDEVRRKFSRESMLPDRLLLCPEGLLDGGLLSLTLSLSAALWWSSDAPTV